jgi:hypothetical protein
MNDDWDNAFAEMEQAQPTPAAAPLAPAPATPKPRQKPKPRQSRADVQKWVKVPIAWKEQLKGTTGAAYGLALELLTESWWKDDKTVVVSNELLARAGIATRHTRKAALEQLQQQGLIRVEQHGNQAPRATLAVH